MQSITDWLYAVTQAMGCLCESIQRVRLVSRLNVVPNQAAIVIIQEASGGVTSRSLLKAQRSQANPFALTPEALMGREFLVIRAMPATQAETNKDGWLRLANEFYETVGDTTPMLRG